MKNQKKHELLKHAYDNYPKGTRFIPFLDKGTYTSSGSFELNEDDFNAISDVKNGYYIYEYGKWAEIIPEQPQKIAVKVENEKERDLLEIHFKSLGWDFGFRKYPLVKFYDSTANGYSGNPIKLSVNNAKDAGYKVLSFSDFAKEHNIKLPLIKSEDGVWLYEGDEFWGVFLNPSLKTWYINNYNLAYGPFVLLKIDGEGNEDFPYVSSPSTNKAFSTKQAALDWIEAQKPKEIVIKLTNSIEAIITKDKVVFKMDDKKYSPQFFNKQHIEAIHKAMRELS